MKRKLGFRMTVEQCQNLSALIRAYETAIVYRGANPSALQLAKLFARMERTRGALILFGVDRTGNVLGLQKAEVKRLYRKLKPLCREQTSYLVKIGTMVCGDCSVMFLIFNATKGNISPLDAYRDRIKKVATL